MGPWGNAPGATRPIGGMEGAAPASGTLGEHGPGSTAGCTGAVRRWLIAAAREHADDPESVIFSEALADDLDAAGITYGPGELTAILQALVAQQRISLEPAGVHRTTMQRSGGWFITPLPALLADVG